MQRALLQCRGKLQQPTLPDRQQGGGNACEVLTTEGAVQETAHGVERHGLRCVEAACLQHKLISGQSARPASPTACFCRSPFRR